MKRKKYDILRQKFWLKTLFHVILKKPNLLICKNKQRALRTASWTFKTQHPVSELFVALQEQEGRPKQGGSALPKDVSLLDLDDCKYCTLALFLLLYLLIHLKSRAASRGSGRSPIAGSLPEYTGQTCLGLESPSAASQGHWQGAGREAEQSGPRWCCCHKPQLEVRYHKASPAERGRMPVLHLPQNTNLVQKDLWKNKARKL